jgi:outer membrane protein OmpA-like peptidoglycan-associated protein
VSTKERSSADYTGKVESPFLDEELFIGESEEEWEPRVAALAAESPFQSAFEQGQGHFESPEMEEPESFGEEDFTGTDYEADELELLHEQPLEERFDPSAIPKDVADALGKKDWPLALKLAIQAGWRDENDLTNLIFFARHPELPLEKLDPKGPKFKQLSREWSRILDSEVWKAIEAAAENTDLVVSGKEVTDHHRRFFRGKSGKRLKKLVEDAAREADLNPGLLGTIMMAETRRPQSYLSSEKVSSYHIGADDFYEGRAAIKARVPAYAKVKWDKSQKPSEHLNDAKKPRLVKTIMFDSGPDAVLATAVYVKFREVRLREIAAELKGDFDKLPLPTRFALTWMAMAAGTAGATPFLKDALEGKDIFVREAIRVRAYQTQRNATVRTAQAMHLSEWIFVISVPAAAAQPKLEAFEYFDDAEFSDDGFEDVAEASYENVDPELAEEVWQPDHETEDNGDPPEVEDWVLRDEPYSLGVKLEENEFRPNSLPAKAREHFGLYDSALGEREMEAFVSKKTGEGKISELAISAQNCPIAHLLSNFDIDSAALKPAHRRFLQDRLVLVLQTNRNNEVELVGRASRSGTAAHNLKLSAKRVKAVADFLIAAGIPRSNIRTQFIGSQSPFSLNREAEEDRSVEVRPRIARVFTLSLIDVGLIPRASVVIKTIEDALAPLVRQAGRELKIVRSVLPGTGDVTLTFDPGGRGQRPCQMLILGMDGGGEIFVGAHRDLRVCSGIVLNAQGQPDHQSQLEHVFEFNEPEFAVAVANTAIHELGHIMAQLPHVNDFSNFMHSAGRLGSDLPQNMRTRKTMRQHYAQRGRFDAAQSAKLVCAIQTGFFPNVIRTRRTGSTTPPIRSRVPAGRP